MNVARTAAAIRIHRKQPPTTMILETVDSTAMHAIGYDWDRHVMEIVFLNGGIYRFANVPPAVFMGLLRARSKGSYFQENIRGRYLNQRIGRFRRRFQRAQPVPTRSGEPTTGSGRSGPRADA